MPWGSSPLARGTFREQFKHHGGGRLIPAHAGNTPITSPKPAPTTAHPRSRGEHFFEKSREKIHFGSSPLARGTQQRPPHYRPNRRLIPARAGEHKSAGIADDEPTGSSPLARGTLIQPARESQQPRLIPARAGNTAHVVHERSLTPAHPRSRGEHVRRVGCRYS